MNIDQLRRKIRTTTHQNEHQVVNQLLHSNPLSAQTREKVLQQARELVGQCRSNKSSKGLLDAFLLQFGLSNNEGVALMCLAEALLRVPDADTADRLIAEKILSGKWHEHRGQSQSAFVNAATWGLMLTGQIVSLDSEITEHTDSWLKRLSARLSEPVVRRAVMQAMKIMGGQYVLGRDIGEGLQRGAKHNDAQTRFSFDMLGEGARTESDAARYLQSYADAITEIGRHTSETWVYSNNGISVKLSALHPRYRYAQHQQVMDELLPRIKQLCLLAQEHHIGLSIDAEESYRLDISLDLFQALAEDPDLKNWQGLGFVLQAYQKRAPDVARWLIALAEATQRKLMVRLVKGAYWDAEIKHTQELGLESYPVYTRKANTDLCYQHCAELLLDADQQIYPQFATHNAYTACMILALAGERAFEFQRLHGMGHVLYEQLMNNLGREKIPLRVYAPIGNHRDLLPYLVRRLLENGANSSFVNRFLDNNSPVDELVQDIREQVCRVFPYEHRQIPAPADLFATSNQARKNSIGIDLDSVIDSQPIIDVIARANQKPLTAGPLIDGELILTTPEPRFSPSQNKQHIGDISRATAEHMQHALTSAAQAQPAWDSLGGEHRAAVLDKMADLMEYQIAELMSVIVSEGGRTLPDALSEVREAVDFCRYYAVQARQQFRHDDPAQRHGRGVFLCISPWNFPLAIFVGQVSAAMAAGNSVIAKPADQTPFIASHAVQLFHKAGVPVSALQLLIGSGSQIGKVLIPDSRIAGIAFTGSTQTAQTINRQLAQRPGGPIPFIAETGGQNCMVVDSTALPEQVVDDVIASAFQSAGQRCSALRVLFLQSDIADNVLTMLRGAMASVHAGHPGKLSSDIGPVIDSAAQAELQSHIERMHQEGTYIASVELSAECQQGSFIAPHVFEIKTLDQLTEEVFGPILHVIRYNSAQLSSVIQQINNTGYGLTLGIHSRIEAFAETVFRNTIAGNTYINRNMVGAVVGVNPFGGRGLSGTGPKAGGPNYLLHFSTEAIDSAQSSNNVLPLKLDNAEPVSATAITSALDAGKKWQLNTAQQRLSLIQQANQHNPHFLSGLQAITQEKLSTPEQLPGPTGEDNQLSLHSRGLMVLVITQQDSFADAEKQIASALLCGCPLIITADSQHQQSLSALQASYSQAGLPQNLLQIAPLASLSALATHNSVEGIVANTSDTDSSALRQIMAERTGSIIPLIEWPKQDTGYHYPWLLSFLSERTRTENLVARGGNTQLFNLAE